MKIWNVPVVIGTSDEYSKIQTHDLRDWFEEFEKRFARDFSYIRLKFGEPKFAGRVPVEEKPYPEFVKEWQEEADSELEKLAKGEE